MNDHPEWLVRLLVELRQLWPLDRPLNIVLQDAHFWEHYGYPSADGLCQIQDAVITIHLRRDCGSEWYMREVLLHEYAHAILAPLTEGADQTTEYVEAVEAFVKRLGGLLLYAYNIGGTYPYESVTE